ncbi:hypothetical protein [Cellulophaga sp. BC115SP]|uniref:hypothetical protein n=1 Tax=Cellulophaga sp. BC115SP TaxID=2683263 RepID=UPI001412375A|nr:hypothetical protein [Cellulophaga sp. BC115SP]NBB26980.1 hypothetical protein [Cellulophaga sp. BC115SP]
MFINILNIKVVSKQQDKKSIFTKNSAYQISCLTNENILSPTSDKLFFMAL